MIHRYRISLPHFEFVTTKIKLLGDMSPRYLSMFDVVAVCMCGRVCGGNLELDPCATVYIIALIQKQTMCDVVFC